MSLISAEEKRAAPRFACVVLAAGAGMRFGAPKASAILPDGTTFAEKVVRTARSCGADPVVAVMGKGGAAPAGAVAAENPDPSTPQIRSVQIGLGKLANSTVRGTLVWPVDTPLVRSETVAAIVGAAFETGARIVVPAYEQRNGHPTYFDRETWPELMVAREDGAREVVRRDERRVLRLHLPDPGVVADINTRDDLARALEETRP